MIISSMLMDGVRLWIGLLFIAKAQNNRSLALKEGVLLFGGVCCIRFIAAHLSNLAWVGLGLEVLWLAFCAGRYCRLNFRRGVFVGTFYIVATAMWQFIFAAGLGILARSTAFLDTTTFEGQIAGWLVNGVLALGGIIVAKRTDITRPAVMRLVTGGVLAGFFAVITLTEQKVIALADDTVYMWIIFVLVLMMGLLVENFSYQYEVEKELARLKSEQAELLEREYTALEKTYALNAKLFHDWHHHISVLQQLLAHEKYPEAAAYLHDLQSPLQEREEAVWTGDETIDYVLTDKKAKALQKHIAFQMQVEFPRRSNLRSVDMCTILANLLDNAIEAAEKVKPDEKRWISLTIRRINQMLVIKVENSYTESVLQSGGALQTTKTAAGLHGWGLKSVQTAAEKYDGLLRTSYDDKRFQAVVTLSYQGVPLA